MLQSGQKGSFLDLPAKPDDGFGCVAAAVTELDSVAAAETSQVPSPPSIAAKLLVPPPARDERPSRRRFAGVSFCSFRWRSLLWRNKCWNSFLISQILDFFVEPTHQRPELALWMSKTPPFAKGILRQTRRNVSDELIIIPQVLTKGQHLIHMHPDLPRTNSRSSSEVGNCCRLR